MKLSDLANQLGCTLEGDGAIEITGVAGIEEAQPGQLTFLANPRYRAAVKETRASAILIAAEEPPPPVAALRTANPYFDFARALELFYQPPAFAAPGIHPAAVIAPSARVGAGAHIGPYCFIDENVELGRNAVLHSHVVIYREARVGDNFLAHSHAVVREYCRIGNRVILQNGAVIGGDGFGFAKQADGRWYKIVQSGITVIEDDVEVQALAAVDRATVGETRIRRGAKLDNLVQVGHASKVGEDTLLCSQVGLAGSTEVGDRCILAGQVGAAGHLRIGDGAVLTAQSGVPNDVPAGAVYSGYPAIENKQWLKCAAAYNRLPELQKTVRDLKAEIDRLRSAAAR
ncbi:MAG: UDP-3-O-(3-hydroxymyristoyl)glucosamine N-acyltransferase [Candidatus Acidiferrales bacterium]